MFAVNSADSEVCETVMVSRVSPFTELVTNNNCLHQLQSDIDSTFSDFHCNSNKNSLTISCEEVAMEQETVDVECHTGTNTSTGASESWSARFSSSSFVNLGTATSDETGTDWEIDAVEGIKRKMSFLTESEFENSDSDHTPSTKKFKEEIQELSTDIDHSSSARERFFKVTKNKIIHVGQSALNSSSHEDCCTDKVTWRPLPHLNQQVLPNGSYIKFEFCMTDMSASSTPEMISVVLDVLEFTEEGVLGTVIQEGVGDEIVHQEEPRYFEFKRIRNLSTSTVAPKRL